MPTREVAIDANLGVGVQAGRVVFCPFVVAGRSHLGSGMGRLKGGRHELAVVLSSFFFKLELPQKPCSLRSRDCEPLLGVS